MPLPLPKPTASRMVMYQPREKGAKPWPAIVVEVFEDKGVTKCDLFLFPTRGQGLQALKEGVLFTTATPGAPDTCSWPPRPTE